MTRGFVQTLRDVEKLSRETQSVMLEVVAEIDARGIAVREGFSTTQRLLGGMLHLSVAEARARVEHAAMVGSRRTITGETLASRLLATAAVLELWLRDRRDGRLGLEGRLDAEHGTMVRALIEQLAARRTAPKAPQKPG